MSLLGLFDAAIRTRLTAIERWHNEGTNCYRLFHGLAEGFPGLSIDRMGPLLVLQTWQAPLEAGEMEALTNIASNILNLPLVPCWNHIAPPIDLNRWHQPTLPETCIGLELQQRYTLTPRGRKNRPRLETALRPARRWLSRHTQGESVLDLFTRGGSLGRAAASGGAANVWYIDRDPAALQWGKACDSLDPHRRPIGRWLESECMPVLRQLTGRDMELIDRRSIEYVQVKKRVFDVVILDPPQHSKGPFGSINLSQEPFHYLKLALECTRPGGRLLLIHRDPVLERKIWLERILRLGQSMNLRLDFQVLHPEEDFPDPAHYPALKMVVLERD